MGFKKPLDPCNLTKLSINLHYGNYLSEIVGNNEEAIKICETALNDCMANINDVDED